MIYVEDLFAIFSQTEEEQERYFPVLPGDIRVHIGEFEIITKSARLVALCALAEKCMSAVVRSGELGQVCGELSSLVNLLIEVSGIWPWLVAHPLEVQTGTGAQVVEPSIYGVWDIVRRLSILGLKLSAIGSIPKDFMAYFSSILRAVSPPPGECRPGP